MSLTLEHNGETVTLTLSFAGIENTEHYLDLIPYSPYIDLSQEASMFRVTASSNAAPDIVDGYGIIYLEKVIEKKHYNLHNYTYHLYQDGYLINRDDEKVALRALINISGQYRPTWQDPAFMESQSKESSCCIVFVDKMIIHEPYRNQGYGTLIWNNLASLFADSDLAVRYMMTIALPFDLAPRTEKYNRMYRIMAHITEKMGFVPNVYSGASWPGIVHIKQFNEVIPVPDYLAERHDGRCNLYYREIMQETEETRK